MSKKKTVAENDGLEYEVKEKKPFYKRWWFLALAAIFIFSAFSGSGEDDPELIEDTLEEEQIAEEEQISEKVVEEKPTEQDVPSEYKSALKKAEVYATSMHMSKQGVYDQLTSEYGEKFPAEAAQYAIDNLNVDWKDQALKKGKTYASNMYMSKQGVYDQLSSDAGEKFTADQAQYAIDNLVDVDWKENALQKAKTYQETMAMSKEGIRDQLTSAYGEQFTAEEADYAVQNLN